MPDFCGSPLLKIESQRLTKAETPLLAAIPA
jgi:hypothetical protein